MIYTQCELRHAVQSFLNMNGQTGRQYYEP